MRKELEGKSRGGTEEGERHCVQGTIGKDEMHGAVELLRIQENGKGYILFLL